MSEERFKAIKLALVANDPWLSLSGNEGLVSAIATGIEAGLSWHAKSTIQDLVDQWASGEPGWSVMLHEYLGITQAQWMDLVKYGKGGHDAFSLIEVRPEE